LIAKTIVSLLQRLIPPSRAAEPEFCQQESIIAVEYARARLSRKHWGSHDLHPWSSVEPGGAAVGAIWLTATDADVQEPALLIKLLYASEALAIRIHPDDGLARSIDLAHGGIEAWYTLSASPNDKIAVGLIWRQTIIQQLRTSIEDGLIAGMVCRRHVQPGDVVFVPVGTIHPIGPGLVVAEIRQRSDATFRFFDLGGQRELYIDNAVTLADACPTGAQNVSGRLTDFGTLLIAYAYVVLEYIDLPPDSNRLLNAVSETWLLALDDDAQIGPTTLSTGETTLPEADRVAVQVGPNGFSGRVAYLGTEPWQGLLSALTERGPSSSIQSMEMLS
jgi:mannose-6-phosphate isomerase